MKLISFSINIQLMDGLFRSYNRVIAVETNCNELLDYLTHNDFPKTTIADFSTSSDMPELVFEYKDRSVQRFTANLEGEDKRIYISGRYYHDVLPAQLVFILLAAFERLHSEMGNYSLEAGSVSKEGQGLLAIGQTYAGKTSIVQKFCQNGYEYVADERTLLSENGELIAGNKIMSIRGDDGKERISPTDFDYKMSTVPSMLKKLAYIGIHPASSIRKLDPQRARWMLYRDFSHEIRTVGYSLNFIPIESFDSPPIAIKRLRFIDRLVNEHDIYEIRGESDFITKSMVDI